MCFRKCTQKVKHETFFANVQLAQTVRFVVRRQYRATIEKHHQHFVARWLVYVKAAFCSMRLCLVNCMLAQPHLQNATGGFPFDNIFTFHLASVMSESPPTFLNPFHVVARRRLDATVCGAEKFKFKFKIILRACGRPVLGAGTWKNW